MKTCSTCGLEFPRSGFTADRRAKDGLFSQCIGCKKESQKRWNRENRDKLRDASLRFKAANPHAAKIAKANGTAGRFGAEGELTVEDWLIVLEKYGEVCLRCGNRDSIQMDHVVPLGVGGSNSRDNIQPLCADCNMRKGVKIEDYR